MGSGFQADLEVMYDENLSVFGREITFIPQETGEPHLLQAIVTPGAGPEGTDMDVYLHASAKVSAFPRKPANGDKVIVEASIYHIVDIEAGGDGWIKMRLRFHAETT
jgi:hypothetical protein